MAKRKSSAKEITTLKKRLAKLIRSSKYGKPIKKAKRKSTPKAILNRRYGKIAFKSVPKKRNITRVRKNPIVSKEPKFVIEAKQGTKFFYYQLGSKGVSKPLQGLFTSIKSKASNLAKYNAAKVARDILPYLDNRIEYIKVVPA